MAKFRMVPEDAAEAAHIHELMQADIAKNLPELNKDLKMLRKRLEWVERWESIAADLAEEERLDTLTPPPLIGSKSAQKEVKSETKTKTPASP